MWGVTARVAREVTCRIAGHMIRDMTEAIAWLVTDQAAGQTAEEALRRTAVEVTLRTMSKIASPTTDETTVPATSQTIRGAIPRTREGTFGNPTQPTWHQAVSNTEALTVLYLISKPEPLASRGSDLFGWTSQPYTALFLPFSCVHMPKSPKRAYSGRFPPRWVVRGRVRE